MSGNKIRNGLRVSLLLIAFAIISATSLRAADYPDHSVKVIVPFPPGGATDITGRIVTQKLSERLGQQFFIENISGAGGNIGMTAAARAPRDGYTILLASSSIVVNPSLYKSILSTSTRISSRSRRSAPRRTRGRSTPRFRPRRCKS
jgi:tripartite-type tricarboxylate transporter receptor subunit TctC